jgi:hypothetical protein
MQFLFILSRINGLYMFLALLAHPQEELHKRCLVLLHKICVFSGTQYSYFGVPLWQSVDRRLMSAWNALSAHSGCSCGPQKLCWLTALYGAIVQIINSRLTQCLDQYSETNVMHSLFSTLRIKTLYMFQALLAHPQEELHKRCLVYCVRVMSVGCTRFGVPTDITRAVRLYYDAGQQNVKQCLESM